MHDDETSKAPSANRMPWEAGYEAPQQQSAQQSGPVQPQKTWGQPQQTWQNAPAQGWQQGPVSMDPTTSTRVDKPRRGIGAWVLPIMLVLAGVAAFAIVTFFMTGKDSEPNSVSAPASGQSDTSTSQSPSSTTSSSTSEAHDDFPADADTSCTEGNDTVGNSAQDAVRRVQGSGTSCVFLQAVRSKVLEHISDDPKATNFQITAHSQATDRDYVMSCQRTNHVSYCSGGNNAAMYVKDTIS